MSYTGIKSKSDFERIVDELSVLGEEFDGAQKELAPLRAHFRGAAPLHEQVAAELNRLQTACHEAAAGQPATFNINSLVWVRLTEHGRMTHRENYDNLFQLTKPFYEYSAPAEDADGWSKWQLWDLMHEFGAHTEMGAAVCFETEIRLRSPQ